MVPHPIPTEDRYLQYVKGAKLHQEVPDDSVLTLASVDGGESKPPLPPPKVFRENEGDYNDNFEDDLLGSDEEDPLDAYSFSQAPNFQ